MKPYSELTRDELLALKEELESAFEEIKGKGLKLDMSRGKPGDGAAGIWRKDCSGL